MMAGAGQGAAEVGKQMYSTAATQELEQMRQQAEQDKQQRIQEWQAGQNAAQLQSREGIAAMQEQGANTRAGVANDARIKAAEISAAKPNASRRIMELATLISNGQASKQQQKEYELLIRADPMAILRGQLLQGLGGDTQAPEVAQQFKDGDTRVKDGTTYVRKDGKWYPAE